MPQLAHYSKMFKMALCLSLMTLLTACGGGAGGVESQTQPQADAPGITGTAEYTPTPGNGLDIAFADGTENAGSYDALIEAQWLQMQTCLEVSAQEPTVTVFDDKITPEAPDDDVIRHIDGQILATSHVTETSASIQIHSRDFDGSVGKPASNLRYIMGRYLWLANNLNEREYPYGCAS